MKGGERMKNVTKLSLSGLLAYAVIVASKVNASPPATGGPEQGWAYSPEGPEGVITDPTAAITQVTNYVLGFIVLIATLIIIYGGVLYLTAAGNDDRVAQAKKTISSGIIGMVIAGLAYAIVFFVKTILTDTTV